MFRSRAAGPFQDRDPRRCPLSRFLFYAAPQFALVPPDRWW
jgi:hypothetical protein